MLGNRFCTLAITVLIAAICSGPSLGQDVQRSAGGDHAMAHAGPIDEAVHGTFAFNQERFRESHRHNQPTLLESVPMGALGDVDIVLEPFTVVNEDTVFLSASGDGPDQPIEFDTSSIATFRGSVVGHPGSSVYLAIAPHHGGTGSIRLADGRTFRFSPSTSLARGASTLSLDVFSGSEGSALVEAQDYCGTQTEDVTSSGLGAGRGMGDYSPYLPVDPSAPMLDIEKAIDCDYEYMSMFPNEQVALEFITIMYGEISAIFQRDVRTRVRLVFVRIWTTPDNPYNGDAGSSLSTVSITLNGGFRELRKDAVSLLSGRKDLPFGGVAYLSRGCDSMGRDWVAPKISINGYQTPTFPDPNTPSMYGYNIGVICHELGHNCAARHTHNYGFDTCNFRDPARGTIMSYCGSNGGGGGNRELRFDARVARIMYDFLSTNTECVAIDTDGDTVPDSEQILAEPALDTDNNGLLDSSEDRNQNGIPDGLDIDAGTETDIDGNRVPDRFEPDCNANGLPDHYEIAQGIIEDRTHNGVPDSCEIDCNADGVADVNQFHELLALDLDRNNILDECQDCDNDGAQDFEQLGASGWSYIADSNRIVAINSAGIAVAQSAPVASRFVAAHPDGRVVAFNEDTKELVVLSPDLQTELGRWSEPLCIACELIDLEFQDTTLFLASRSVENTVVVRYDTLDPASRVSVLAAATPGIDGSIAFTSFDSDGFLLASLDRDGSRALEIDRYTSDGQHIERIASIVGDVDGVLVEDLGLLGLEQTASGRLFVLAVDVNDAESRHVLFEVRGGVVSNVAPITGGSSSSSSDWGLQTPVSLLESPDGDLGIVSDGSRVLYREYDPGTLDLLYRHAYHVYEQSTDMPDGETVAVRIAFDAAFAPAAADDCNRNGIPDSCDIAEGRSADANNDGVPDSCAPLRCVADINNDGVATPADFTAWLGAYNAGDMIADTSLDGFVRFDDFSAWLNAFAAGCD